MSSSDPAPHPGAAPAEAGLGVGGQLLVLSVEDVGQQAAGLRPLVEATVDRAPVGIEFGEEGSMADAMTAPVVGEVEARRLTGVRIPASIAATEAAPASRS
ncbi:MAG: hypothetical protein ACFCVK_06480 [Acidimicrobiales bacterium]